MKPVALVGHLGHVALVEGVLWVKYPYANLRAIPRRLKVVAAEIDSALVQLEKEALKNLTDSSWDDPLALLKMYASRIAFVNDTLALALESYLGLEGPALEKRAWLEPIGELSNNIFGTAIQRDVDELRDRYNQLTALASADNREVQLNCQKLAKLDQHVSDLGLYVNRLKLGLDRVFASLDSFYHFLVLNQALPSLENVVNSLMHTNQQIINNVVDAANGRVTPTLFPVRDFMHALEVGKEYELTPLFDIRGVHHYYPLLTSFVTTNDIVIHVPFHSNNVFEMYQIEPFPFSANASLMTLDLSPSIVLISADISLYSADSLSHLSQCHTEYLSYYHCLASLFEFLPITGGVCEVVLTQTADEKVLELCPYTTLAPRTMTHQTFSTTITFSSPPPFTLSLYVLKKLCIKKSQGILLSILLIKYTQPTSPLFLLSYTRNLLATPRLESIL